MLRDGCRSTRLPGTVRLRPIGTPAKEVVMTRGMAQAMEAAMDRAMADIAEPFSAGSSIEVRAIQQRESHATVIVLWGPDPLAAERIAGRRCRRLHYP